MFFTNYSAQSVFSLPHLSLVIDTEEGGAYRVADVTGEEEDSESTAMIHHYSAAVSNKSLSI